MPTLILDYISWIYHSIGYIILISKLTTKPAMDIAMYRARIGTFYASLKSRSVPWRPQVLKLSAQCSLLAVFGLMLLLCGDIEANPGPPKVDQFYFRNPMAASTTDPTPNMNADMSDSTTLDYTSVDNQGQPSMADKIDMVLAGISEVNRRFDKMEDNIEKWKQIVTKKVCELEVKQQKLHENSTKLQDTVERLQSKVNELENDKRANNLIFSGVTLENNVSIVDSVKSFITNELEIPNVERLEIDYAFNLKDRRIVAKFRTPADRKLILDTARSKYSDNPEWKIKPDICKAWQEARKKFAPMYEKAKGEGKNVMVKKDFMIINNKRYVYDTNTDSVIEAPKHKK